MNTCQQALPAPLLAAHYKIGGLKAGLALHGLAPPWGWPHAAAGLVALALMSGLLYGFGAVVQQAVRQGDKHRQASALLAETTWRCKALKAVRQRDDCLGLYRQERPTDSAGVQLLVSDAAGGSRPTSP